MSEYMTNEDDLTPEGADFLLDAIGGLVGDWGKTGWLQMSSDLLKLIAENKFDEVDRRLTAVDVNGPSIVVFACISATHAASHHLHEFEPLLNRAATALDYDNADHLRRQFEQ